MKMLEDIIVKSSVAGCVPTSVAPGKAKPKVPAVTLSTRTVCTYFSQLMYV